MIPNIDEPSGILSSTFPIIVAKNIWHSFLNVYISLDLAPSLRFMVHAMAVSAGYPCVTSFNLSQMSFLEKSSFCISNPSLFDKQFSFDKKFKIFVTKSNKS